MLTMLQEMLGCDWGRAVWTPDDTEPCPEMATRRVEFHNPHNVPGCPDGKVVKLCTWHGTRVCEEETTPHAAS